MTNYFNVTHLIQTSYDTTTGHDASSIKLVYSRQKAPIGRTRALGELRYGPLCGSPDRLKSYFVEFVCPANFEKFAWIGLSRDADDNVMHRNNAYVPWNLGLSAKFDLILLIESCKL